MKFAHIADVHLGYEQYNQPWRAEDFAKAFKIIAEKAVESNVDFVVIAGDLFHRSLPSPRTIKDAIETLRIFRMENIPVFAVEGNHDKTSRDISAYHLLESLGLLNVLGLRRNPVRGENVETLRIQNVYLVKGVVDDVEVLGDRHRSKWQLEKVLPLLKPQSDKSVLVLHQAVKEVVDIDLDMAYELTINDLPNAGYYAFGHIHLPKIYEFDGRAIAYPGSVERYDLREASKIVRYRNELVLKEGIRKGFILVKNFRPEFVEIETRELYDVEIEDESVEGLEKKFLEVLGRADKEGLMVAKLKSSDTVDVRRLSEVAAKRVRYAEIRFERIFEEIEEVEIKQESEFFTEFELKLLDLLRGEMDEDEVYSLVVEHYLSGGALKQEEEAEERMLKEGVKEEDGLVKGDEESAEVERKAEAAEASEKIEKAKSTKKAGKPKTLLDFLGVEEE